MSEWKEYKLGDVINLKRGYDLPNTKRILGQIPIYSSCGISAYHNEAMKDGPGVITGRYGTIGQVFYSKEPYWPLNTTLYVHDFKGNNPKFIYYFLKCLDFNQFNDKSAVPGINRNDVHMALVTLPPLHQQTAIAEVLSSLDDKIDLLQRQSRTLEQLAETIFRQWFFLGGEPRVEKAENGWEEKGLDEIAEFLNGLACQKFPQKAGEIGLPVIKIREMRTGITDSSDWAAADVPEKYIIENGDMLFSWSGSLDIVLWFGGKAILNQHLFKVSSKYYPQWFYYFWTQFHLQDFKEIANEKATTMGHIQRHHLSDAKVVIPPKTELLKIDETINPIFQKIKSNSQQIRTLTQIRDTLLPKLMSGELRVKL